MPSIQELIDVWVEEINNNASYIDPENRLCWESLAIGYYLGKGHSIKQAEFLVRRLQKENKI